MIVGYRDAGEPIMKSLGEAWLDHQFRRQYEGLVFSPGQDVPGRFNLWQGFAVEPAPGNWSLFTDHLLYNICGGNCEYFWYLLTWMAAAVQQPGEPAEVAVVLRGKRGTGKGVFGREFGALFGQHNIHIAHTRHLTNNFNAHLRDAVFVFADEVSWSGDRQAEAVLKMLITEDILAIEPKGQDVQFAKNVIHMLIASNHDWVVPAGLDERRFFVLDVADTHAQDREYFRALSDQMRNGGRAAMLHDLLRLDLSTVDVRQAPGTEALAEQKVHSMEPYQVWWLEKLVDGRLLPTHDGWRTEVLRDDLREDYAAAVGRADMSAHSLATQLGMALRKLLPQGYPRGFQRRHTKVTLETGIMWFWEFPALDVCRAHFDQLTRMRRQWAADPSSGSQSF